MIKWFKLRPDSGEMMDDLDVIRRWGQWWGTFTMVIY